jgi:phosphopantothenoylcysteine synthetase/decarboxylase
MKILITAGPTSEKIDAVRRITNRATGRLGALIAEAFCDGTCANTRLRRESISTMSRDRARSRHLQEKEASGMRMIPRLIATLD